MMEEWASIWRELPWAAALFATAGWGGDIDELKRYTANDGLALVGQLAGSERIHCPDSMSWVVLPCMAPSSTPLGM